MFQEAKMPIYEYKCESCGNEFEELQSFDADVKIPCPKCKKNANRIISSGIGIVFKGSGFYVNDYKKKTKLSSSSGKINKNKEPAKKNPPGEKNKKS